MNAKTFDRKFDSGEKIVDQITLPAVVGPMLNCNIIKQKLVEPQVMAFDQKF